MEKGGILYRRKIQRKGEKVRENNTMDAWKWYRN